MFLLLVSFIAGVLTVLAPCILPLLPVIIGGSLQNHHKRNPYIITASLAASIILFTLILKFSTAFIDVPPIVWSSISGVIIILFGLVSVFPELWERLSFKLGLGTRSNELLTSSANSSSRWSDVLIGASLGPVFSSCSPTYFLILATVLPQSFANGLINLIAYALGLSLVLLLISLLGQKLVRRLSGASNPHGWFKRTLGILFILVGIFILTGYDKKIQTYLVSTGIYKPSALEERLIQKTNTSDTTPITVPQSYKPYPLYHEIAQPAGYVNTSSIKLADLIGKKVILVDFMTYSCINCIRTFPYLNAWYDKYKDQGLEIVGIHTPEFAFEQKKENVEEALKKYGITFPVVLDNSYGTWRAYGNNYWPRKYLIDIDGYVVYDHIGEGEYKKTEEKIQELLNEKMQHDKLVNMRVSDGFVTVTGTESIETISPETYFGYDRNNTLANGSRNQSGVQILTAPTSPKLNQLYLGGTWNFEEQYAENTAKGASILYRYGAKNVYIVASAERPIKARVLQDGKPLTAESAGQDITFENGQSYITIENEQLYHLIRNPKGAAEHTLQIIIEAPGLAAFTFTFG